MDIENKVLQLQKNIYSDACDRFIREHEPFIRATIAKRLNRYVNQSNEEVFSIGLSAFLEAMVHFDAKKGNFYGFAKLVIDRRIINYLKKTKRHHHENIDDYVIPDPQEPLDEQVMLKDELQSFERVLNNFNITFEDLIEDTPKHIDTRNRAKQIGKQVSEDKTITEKLYQKYKLPVTAICNKFMVTRKVIYGCKKYITSIAIVYIEKFDLLKKWI